MPLRGTLRHVPRQGESVCVWILHPLQRAQEALEVHCPLLRPAVYRGVDLVPRKSTTVGTLQWWRVACLVSVFSSLRYCCSSEMSRMSGHGQYQT
jgi:hypothetical protein